MCWCSMCGQALLSKDLLAAHVAEHEKFFPFFCALCDANFMEGQLLKIHVATKHTVEHSLQCQTCGMYFKQRGSLSTHMKYCRQAPACVVCAVRFPNGDELEKHYYTYVKHCIEQCVPMMFCHLKFYIYYMHTCVHVQIQSFLNAHILMH